MLLGKEWSWGERGGCVVCLVLWDILCVWLLKELEKEFWFIVIVGLGVIGVCEVMR